MKRLVLIFSFFTLTLGLSAAALYRVAPRTLKDLLPAIVSARTSEHPATPLARTPEDLKVSFHESQVTNQPGAAEAHRLLAQALVTRAEATGNPADYDRAWLELDRANTLEPGNLRILYSRAALLQSRHRFGQARSLAEQGLQRAPDDPELLGLAGDTALALGDFDGAEAHYRKLAGVWTELPTVWGRLSYLAESRGDIDEAAALMEKQIKVGSDNRMNNAGLARLHTFLGEIEAKRGRLDVARGHYLTALGKAPDYRLAVEFLADLDQWQGNTQAAEDGYRKLLARRFDPKIQLRLADLVERMGERAEASRLRAESLHFFERAVEGGNEGYLRDLATLDLAAGRYSRALELAARDLALRPTRESRALYTSAQKAAAAAGQQDGKP